MKICNEFQYFWCQSQIVPSWSNFLTKCWFFSSQRQYWFHFCCKQGPEIRFMDPGARNMQKQGCTLSDLSGKCMLNDISCYFNKMYLFHWCGKCRFYTIARKRQRALKVAPVCQWLVPFKQSVAGSVVSFGLVLVTFYLSIISWIVEMSIQ